MITTKHGFSEILTPWLTDVGIRSPMDLVEVNGILVTCWRGGIGFMDDSPAAISALLPYLPLHLDIIAGAFVKVPNE